MISKIKQLFLLCLVFVLSFSIVGCSKNEKRKDKNQTGIYYTNEDFVDIILVPRKINVHENGQLGAEEMIDQMSRVNKDSKYRSAIPEKVVINGVTVVNNVASVDFSTGYNKISSKEDLICRAAIVYTLTQNKAISFVEFSVAGQSMLDTDGKAYGALNRDSFAFGDLPVDLEN